MVLQRYAATAIIRNNLVAVRKVAKRNVDLNYCSKVYLICVQLFLSCVYLTSRCYFYMEMVSWKEILICKKKDPTWKKILSCIKEFQSLAHFFSNCPLFSVDEYLFKVHIKDTRSYPVGVVLLSVFLSLNKCFPARQFFYKNIIVF